jgi:hypothetical protein
MVRAAPQKKRDGEFEECDAWCVLHWLGTGLQEGMGRQRGRRRGKSNCSSQCWDGMGKRECRRIRRRCVIAVDNV